MIKKIIEYIKGYFHKNYAYDISNPEEILKVKIKAYNADTDSFIVENEDDIYLPKHCMISKSNIVFPLSEEDKKTIESITNVPFCGDGYCLKRTYEGRKEILQCKIVGLAENKFLLVQYRYPYLDMFLNVNYGGAYKLIKMKEFMVRKDR